MEEAVKPHFKAYQRLNGELTKILKGLPCSSRDKRERKKREELRIAEATLRDAIQPYAKPLCQSLCDAICKGLPREVRDMIYEYIHEQETIYVGPEFLRKTSPPCETDPDAHYWDADYMGHEMQREMVESWYRTTLFYFYDKANNVSVINQFLDFDRWGLDVKPRYYICRIRIELSVDNKIHHPLPHTSTMTTIPYKCCTIRDVGTRLIKPLENLEQLPNHVHFFIRIHTYGALENDCLGPEELQKTFEVLVRCLKDLHSAGHRFVVQWPELRNLELSSTTRIFSSEEWIKKLQASSGPV